MYFEELVARAKEAAIKEKKRAAKAEEAFTEALRGAREVKAGMSWDDARPLLASHRHFQGVRARLEVQVRGTLLGAGSLGTSRSRSRTRGSSAAQAACIGRWSVTKLSTKLCQREECHWLHSTCMQITKHPSLPLAALVTINREQQCSGRPCAPVCPYLYFPLSPAGKFQLDKHPLVRPSHQLSTLRC